VGVEAANLVVEPTQAEVEEFGRLRSYAVPQLQFQPPTVLHVLNVHEFQILDRRGRLLELFLLSPLLAGD
jgi:hypothetical protein